MAKHTKDNAMDMFSKIEPMSPPEKPTTEKPEEVKKTKPEKTPEKVDEGKTVPNKEREKASSTNKQSQNKEEPWTGSSGSGVNLMMGGSQREKIRHSHTFYLDDYYFEMLKTGSEKNKVSISVYLEYILEQVF